MDQATRTEALAKLAAIEARVGHPSKYTNYSSLKIDRQDLLGNVIRAKDFAWTLQLSRLGYPAVNYGAAGMLIGHELSHAFDTTGRDFDATGKIRDWWTPTSAKRFEERTAQVIKQFGEFQPLPSMNVNGKLTLGENIADLGGIQVAYAAYRRSVTRTGEPPVLDGLTGDQRFFLSNAQSKREKVREGRLREILLTNPHSPSAYA